MNMIISGKFLPYTTILQNSYITSTEIMVASIQIILLSNPVKATAVSS
jgi:hypothetical protein